MIFDYSKLRGRIREVVGSETSVAKMLNYSNRTFSLKLNNKVKMSQNDIIELCNILNISQEEIGSYFFRIKVQGTEQ